MILWSCYSHLRQWIVPIMYLLMFWAQFRRCFLENNLWWSKNKHLKHALRQTFLIFHHHCRETIFVEAILTRYHKCLTEKKRPFSTPTIIVHQHVNQRKLEVVTIVKPRRHDKHSQHSYFRRVAMLIENTDVRVIQEPLLNLFQFGSIYERISLLKRYCFILSKFTTT